MAVSVPSHADLLLTGAVGLAAGSFLNVVIHRMPIMMARQSGEAMVGHGAGGHDDAYNLAFPGSGCPACGARIRAVHNIPLVGFLWLRGRCVNCGVAISWRYPVVEALGAVAAVGLALQYGLTLPFVAALLFVWIGIAIVFIDAEHMLIPDALALPLLWLGLLANSTGLFVPVQDAVWGAALGYLSLAVFHWGGPLLLQRDVMGRGDLKLFAAIGAWAGWQGLPLTLFLASFLGAVTGGVAMLVRREGRGAMVPFGPFLMVAGMIALLWSEPILRVYWALWR